MTEKERDIILYNAETRVMKNKMNCKTPKIQEEYGTTATAIHRDRTMRLRNIDTETNTGICSCGRPVDICDEPVYCRYCGQRTSGTFGWTIDDYYNENHT